MTKTLTLLIATTALTAAIGLPAWSAIQSAATATVADIATVQTVEQPQPILADSDGGEARAGGQADDDEDECEEDDGGCGAANNPAPAGTVAPPQNGLFSTGAAPQVQVN
jgi:hypothetical protein